MRYPLPWFLLSDDPSRCSCRTIRGCRPYRSFLLGCRFGRSGSSGFVGGFRRLRLSNRGLGLKARRSLGRYRYRYTCRPNGFLAADGCRPKRIDRAAGSGGGFAGNTGFGRQFLLELVVHVEHIAGANDVALADFNRRRMHHRPGGFGGGTGKYALAARKGGFVTGSAVGFTGLEDEGGLAVEADVFGNGFGIAQVGEEREGDGCDRRSRRGRPTEIGEDKDDSKVAVFAGDFVEGHDGILC